MWIAIRRFIKRLINTIEGKTDSNRTGALRRARGHRAEEVSFPVWFTGREVLCPLIGSWFPIPAVPGRREEGNLLAWGLRGETALRLESTRSWIEKSIEKLYKMV